MKIDHLEHAVKIYSLSGRCIFSSLDRTLEALRVEAAVADAARLSRERMPALSFTISFQAAESDIQRWKEEMQMHSATCDLCCHFQTHPPRCRLSKRRISPKQFTCKKYSPKHN